ncbi:MAG: flagellar basal body rod protein FlgG, partial [Deltaproteobacteria bacterium]|nr:flagellar basal body rod protein FlgG [Deltaproteobacteria bacterium]
MNLGVYNAVRGCKIQQLKLDTIANNLANAA